MARAARRSTSSTPAEVAAVARVPIAELVDPASRLRVTHPSGWIGPAFEVRDLLVWGFTAGLLDRLLALGGWERPWDTTPAAAARRADGAPRAARRDLPAPDALRPVTPRRSGEPPAVA